MSHAVEEEMQREVDVSAVSEEYALYRAFADADAVAATVEGVYTDGDSEAYFFGLRVLDETVYIAVDTERDFEAFHRVFSDVFKRVDGAVRVCDEHELRVTLVPEESESESDSDSDGTGHGVVSVSPEDGGEAFEFLFSPTLPGAANAVSDGELRELLDVVEAAEFYHTRQSGVPGAVRVELGEIVSVERDGERVVEVAVPYGVGGSGGAGTSVCVPVPTVETPGLVAGGGRELIEYCGGSVSDVEGARVYLSPVVGECNGLVTENGVFGVFTKDQYVEGRDSVGVCGECGVVIGDREVGVCCECYDSKSFKDRFMLTIENTTDGFQGDNELEDVAVAFLMSGVMIGATYVLGQVGGSASSVSVMAYVVSGVLLLLPVGIIASVIEHM